MGGRGWGVEGAGGEAGGGEEGAGEELGATSLWATRECDWQRLLEGGARAESHVLTAPTPMACGPRSVP